MSEPTPSPRDLDTELGELLRRQDDATPDIADLLAEVCRLTEERDAFMAEARRMHRVWDQSGKNDLIEERDAALAVIDAAPHDDPCLAARPTIGPCNCWKSAVPRDVLDARIRAERADAALRTARPQLFRAEQEGSL